MNKQLLLITTVVFLQACTSTDISCAIAGGCNAKQRQQMEEAVRESDRAMNQRYGGDPASQAINSIKSQPATGYYYELTFDDGSKTCRVQSATSDPRGYQGSTVNGKKVIKVRSEIWGTGC